MADVSHLNHYIRRAHLQASQRWSVLTCGSSIKWDEDLTRPLWAPPPNPWSQFNHEEKNFRQIPGKGLPIKRRRAMNTSVQGNLDWSGTPMAPALWRLTQEGHQGFEPTLSYIASTRPAWTKVYLKTTKQKQKHQGIFACITGKRKLRTLQHSLITSRIETHNGHSDIRRKPRESE